MKALRPGQPAPACRFCGAALTALERVRGDACGRIDCRRRSVNETGAAERAADLDRRRHAALRAGASAAVGAAPVIWMTEHATRLVPLSPARRATHAEHLHALALLPEVPDRIAPAADAAPDAPISARVCGFCAGRCCRHGAQANAFLLRVHLSRWVARHAGATPADAAADYERRLPARHVEHSCVYHGRAGCVLPREMRADICNDYGCDALRSAQALERPGEGAVVVMPGLAAVRRAAWVNDEASLALPRRPRRP